MADLSQSEIVEPKVETLKQHYLRRGVLYHALEAVSFSGTTLQDEMLIRNPSGSGINMIIFELRAELDLGATTSQLNQLVIDVRKNPTVTADGSSITSSGNKKSGESNAHQADLFGQPTISAAGGNTILGCLAINSKAELQDILLEPGDELLVQCRTNDSANNAFIEMEWAEDLIS